MQKYKRKLAMLLAIFQIITAKIVVSAESKKVDYFVDHTTVTVVILDDEEDLNSEFDKSKIGKQSFEKKTSKIKDNTDKSFTYQVISQDNNLYLAFDGANNYYRRRNKNNGKYEPISIFDEENIKSKQYGANQKDFSNRFDSIINDPLIIEEMEKYYPIDDIVASDNFKLYKVDSDNNKYDVLDNVGSHYVYITDITEDGKIVVSSWGEKYIFDDTNALWTSKILIKKLD